MFLNVDVDLSEIKFECNNCGKLLEIDERPFVQKVKIEPCKCILEDK